MAEDFFDAGEAADVGVSGAAAAVGVGAIAEIFALALEGRAEAGVFEVLLTKAKTGMRKDLKLVPVALTVR